jgi:DNA-binding MarR family transcriptional regulator
LKLPRHKLLYAIKPDRHMKDAFKPDHFDLIELMFFAYRDFTGDPDALLEKDGFGRAHHRVLHFVGRNPGLTVAELLAILGITKQSLARVLKELIDRGHISQTTGQNDRRQRQLFLTDSGGNLAFELSAPQSRRIANALSKLEGAGAIHVRQFLHDMIDAEKRVQFDALQQPKKE